MEINVATRRSRLLVRRTLRWGLAASLALHAILIGVMLFGSVRSWLDERPIEYLQVSQSDVRDAAAEPPAVATVVIRDEDPLPPGIEQHLETAQAAAEQMTETERLQALDEATQRLGRISSETGVNDVAQRLQGWLGLTPRAEHPTTDALANSESDELLGDELSGADPSAGAESAGAATENKFDLETAQLHDVKRTVGAGGELHYVCVMLDASGRTMDVPLSEAEGEPIYTLMEKIKASPLLEQIYRQLAMPMLDQLVKAQQLATEAAATASAKAAAEVVAEEQPAESGAGGDLPTLIPPVDERTVDERR